MSPAGAEAVTFWEAMGLWALGGPWPMVQVDWVEEL